jgi:hypothetical protein
MRLFVTRPRFCAQRGCLLFLGGLSWSLIQHSQLARGVGMCSVWRPCPRDAALFVYVVLQGSNPKPQAHTDAILPTIVGSLSVTPLRLTIT